MHPYPLWGMVFCHLELVVDGPPSRLDVVDDTQAELSNYSLICGQQ